MHTCFNTSHFMLVFSLVSVRSQQLILCRATVDCLGANLGVMTARDCCVNNPMGLAYTDEQSAETCTPCIGECIDASLLIQCIIHVANLTGIIGFCKTI